MDVIWDVMNEPDHQPQDWVEHYLGLVKELDPASLRTVGYFFPSSAATTAEQVEILSFHPYGMFRSNVQVPAQEAKGLAAVENTKPVLATELGFPGGGGQRYEDVLDYIGEQGIGFYLFQAMVGDHPLLPLEGRHRLLLQGRHGPRPRGGARLPVAGPEAGLRAGALPPGGLRAEQPVAPLPTHPRRLRRAGGDQAAGGVGATVRRGLSPG